MTLRRTTTTLSIKLAVSEREAGANYHEASPFVRDYLKPSRPTRSRRQSTTEWLTFSSRTKDFGDAAKQYERTATYTRQTLKAAAGTPQFTA